MHQQIFFPAAKKCLCRYFKKSSLLPRDDSMSQSYQRITCLRLRQSQQRINRSLHSRRRTQNKMCQHIKKYISENKPIVSYLGMKLCQTPCLIHSSVTLVQVFKGSLFVPLLLKPPHHKRPKLGIFLSSIQNWCCA
mmetsp:Transcript_38858/g.116827  ORF Transcript_38858/g.116827 Transcript_38858/m.116827 type:complete len:136 (+) Transcript_38858:276-683(+)